jgi:sulfatase maturation enzyme AslB (radical SAM superfamily)
MPFLEKELARGFSVRMNHVFEVLALSHELGVNFGFTTNGYLLSRSNVVQILRHEPFNINVSLESVDPAINESLRPRKNGTQRTLEGIKNVVLEKRRSGSRVSTMVKPTIMEQNCNLDCQRTCQRPISLSTKIRAFVRMG